MADVVQTIADLITECADNTTGAINAQIIRNFIVTMEARSLTKPIRRFTSGASTNLVYKVDQILIVRKSTGSATQVILPPNANLPDGAYFEVKDGKADAAINPITVTGDANIDGLSSYVIGSNKGAATFTWDDVYGEWVQT